MPLAALAAVTSHGAAAYFLEPFIATAPPDND
jgi:hypothetical protein